MTNYADEKRLARLRALLAIHADEQLSAEEQMELASLLRDSAALREEYFRFTTLQALLHIEAQRNSGGAVLPAGVSGVVGAQPLGCAAEEQAKAWTPTALRNPHSPFPKLLRSAAAVVLHPMALVLVMGVLAAGVFAYKFSTAPVAAPVVEHAPAVAPVARLVNSTDAKWLGAVEPSNKQLTPGQHLALEGGTAEILFDNQARVILEGPTEFVVVDAGTCRLSTGKLTAQVPEPAKGFKVHTPSGTVTDLGTEFGVYVDARADQQVSREEEQQPGGGLQLDDKLPPLTEVHVFKGQVDVAPGDQLTQAPTSSIPTPSTILQAGEAVTISDNKVQPLPAADPFKFALDKLQGKPRKLLLAEDFESYDIGVKRDNVGKWIVQGSSRKGQNVSIGDYDKAVADLTALHGPADPSLNPPPPSISRLLVFAPSADNPRSEFPRIVRPIDAFPSADSCQMLVEFVIFPSLAEIEPAEIEPSFSFAAEAGIAPGIEYWRNADAAAPRIPWKKDLVYRVRVLMDVANGKLRDARVERSQWSGSAGWIRDADFRTPVPTVDWTTPPKYVIFGYPTVTPQTPATPYNIDNIRIEVIAER